jgi:hypothetical protein
MSADRSTADIERRYDEMYEQFGRPLERDHRGEFAAISGRGDVILGPSMQDVALKAAAQFGPGSYLFKIGERVVGRWR